MHQAWNCVSHSSKYGLKLVPDYPPNSSRTSQVKENHSKPINKKPYQPAPGIVGADQLKTIRSIINANTNNSDSHLHQEIQSSVTDVEPSNLPDEEQQFLMNNQKYPSGNRELIDSVLRQVIALNKDKLPEESLIRVLSSVYSDAESMLGTRFSRDSFSQPTGQKVDVSQVAIGNSHPEKLQSSLPNSLSISERKRIQWAQERAELATLNSRVSFIGANKVKPAPIQDDRSSVYNAIDQLVKPTTVDPIVTSQAPESLLGTATTTATPALTSLGFTINQDLEDSKREASRRQWLNELDEQVRQRRLAQYEAFVRETPSSNHTTIQTKSFAVATSSNPHVSRKLEAHPSASHFSASGPMLSHGNYQDTATEKPYNCGDIAPGKTQFHRVRGFTNQLYSNPSEDTAQRRLNEETFRVNFEMMQEKRRLREAEKTRELLEDRLDLQRLQRDLGETNIGGTQPNQPKEAENPTSIPAVATNEVRNDLYRKKRAVFDHTAFSSSSSAAVCEPQSRLTDTKEISTNTLDSVTKGNAECQTDILMEDLVISKSKNPSSLWASNNFRGVNTQAKPLHNGNSVTKKPIQPRTDYRSVVSDPKTKQTTNRVHSTRGAVNYTPRQKQIAATDQSEYPSKVISSTAKRGTYTRDARIADLSPVDARNNFAMDQLVSKGHNFNSTFPLREDNSLPSSDVFNVVRTQDTLCPKATYSDRISGRNRNVGLPVGERLSDRNSYNYREHNILQHLSDIRKSLRMRQMQYESKTYDSDDDDGD